MVLCIFVGVTFGEEIDPKCSWGPSYWCQGLKEAKSCGAVKHCKTTAWVNQVILKDTSEVCQFCEAIIGDVKRFISHKKTEEEIAHFLSTACGVIPSQKIADECKGVVQFAITEIIELVSAELDPQMLCSLMRICSGLKDTVNHAPVSEPKQTPPTKLSPLVGVNSEPICTDCKKFFNDIKQMITANKTEEEVKELIDNMICSLLGSVEDECKSLVDTYLPEIMEFFSSYYDPAVICQSLGVCNSANPSQNFLLFLRLRKLQLYKQASQLNSPGSCILCESVMSELQSLDRNKKFQDKIIALVKTKLCANLGSMESSCNEACDMYAAELFELIASELDPKTRCKSLGFCLSGSTNTEVQHLPMVDIQPPSNVIHMKTVAKDPPTTVATDGVKDHPYCVMCEFVMRELRQMIGKNATEEEIMQALEKVCDYMPESLTKSCHSFVEMYGPAIIKMIIEELDPEEICTEIGLCGQVAHKPTSTPTHAPVERTTTNPHPTKPSLESDQTCAVCETIIQYLEALVEQNATTREIEQILEKICNFLPQSMTKQCEDVIEKYGDLVVHFITSMASPKEICTLMGICDGKGKGNLVGGREDVEVKQSVPKLGENECTWGPNYWCINRENAEKCNAVDHCKKYVWKTAKVTI